MAKKRASTNSLAQHSTCNPNAKTPAKCKTKYCRDKAKRCGLCWPCYNKRSRTSNPIRYAYQALKDNAKRRGKVFSLSLEDFIEFCNDNPDYMKRKGRVSGSVQLDRNINEIGYVKGNLIVVGDGINKSKGAKKIMWDYVEKKFVLVEQVMNIIEDDLPF